MTELYSGASQSFNGAIDATRCAADPDGDPITGRADGMHALPAGNPCRVTQYQNFQGGNRNLGAEKSDHWTAGLVWNPLDDLSIALDWYNIELDDEIGLPSMQALLDHEFALRQGGATGTTVGNVTRLANGRIDFVDRRNANIQARKTDGLDVEGQYSFALGNTGDYRVNVQWTYVNEYEVDFADGQGLPILLLRSGEPWHGDAELGVGRLRCEPDLELHRFGHLRVAGCQLDDFTTFDVQVFYNTPWNGTVTVGARNVFDEDPPTSVNIGSPFYSNYLHDVYGRVPYIRYSQDL